MTICVAKTFGLVVCLLLYATVVSAETILFRGDRLFDGDTVHEKTSVLIVDSEIVLVGGAQAPFGAVVVECQGKTLMPGLIDAHVHVPSPVAQRDALRFGVTTQLDMFTSIALLPQFKRNRNSVADMSDVFSAGTMIIAEGGYGSKGRLQIPALKSVNDAANFVGARVAEGSDFIKINIEDGGYLKGGPSYPTLDQESLQAVITAAHKLNKVTVVHVSSEASAVRALEAGADGLAHVFSDRVAGDALIALAKEKHAFVIATLSMIDSATAGNSSKTLLEDDALKPYLSDAQSALLSNSLAESGERRAVYAAAAESVLKLRRSGIPILAGTDSYNPGTAHGVSLHGELVLLVAAGMTPIEALRAATSVPAKIFGLQDRGSIAVGKRADLVLVDGDPTRRIEDTRRIVGIWKNGRALNRQQTKERAP
jgi:imidazolonepropionase-like amidohydrolase